MSNLLRKFFIAVVMVLSAASIVSTANATVITATLPDIDGPVNGSGFPINIGSFGPFVYAIPGSAVINSVTLSGAYGTQIFSTSTAGFDAIVNGFQVTACVPFDPNCWGAGAPFRPFVVNLPPASYFTFLSGSATLSIVQTNQFVVRFGSPTLTIDYSVPEPATLAILGLALLSLLGLAVQRRATL